MAVWYLSNKIMFVGCQGHLCIEWDGWKAYLFTTKSPFVQNGVALWQLFWMYELFGIVLHDVVSMFHEVHFAVVLAIVLMHLDWYSHAMLRYSVCPGGAWQCCNAVTWRVKAAITSGTRCGKAVVLFASCIKIFVFWKCKYNGKVHSIAIVCVFVCRLTLCTSM